MKSILRYKDAFLSHCQYSKNLSANTVMAYSADIKDFNKFIENSLPQEFDSLAKEYHTYLVKIKKLARATTRRRMLVISQFYLWAHKKKYLDEHRFDISELDLRVEKRLPRPIDYSDVEILLKESHSTKKLFQKLDSQNESFSTSEVLRITNNLILQLLICTGLRVGELVSIKIVDVSVAAHRIRIIGKGNKERYVFIENDILLERLGDFVSVIRANALPQESLFVNRSGSPMTTQVVRKRIRSICGKFELQNKITPHRFRHTAATLLIDHGVDIRYVQKLLGHSSITTTELYTAVTDRSLKSALREADPLGDFQ